MTGKTCCLPSCSKHPPGLLSKHRQTKLTQHESCIEAESALGCWLQVLQILTIN